MELLFAGLGGTALGGIVASSFLLLIQERRAPKLGVATNRAVAADAAARLLWAQVAHISHGLRHLRDGDDYEAQIREHVATARRLSRDHVGVLGVGVQQAVERFTDELVSELPEIVASHQLPSESVDRQRTFLSGALEGAAPNFGDGY